MRTNLLQSDGNLKIKRLLGACGMDQNRGFQTPSSKSSSSSAHIGIVLALLGGFLLLEKKKERRRKKFASLFILLLKDFFFSSSQQDMEIFLFKKLWEKGIPKCGKCQT
jgi:hypothetical protein